MFDGQSMRRPYLTILQNETKRGDLRQTLLARGVGVGEISIGYDRSLQMWTADPDGNRVELMEYTHRSQQLQLPGGTVGN